MKSIKSKIIGAALLLLASVAANANPLHWSFTYIGEGISASGLLTTNSTLVGGAYTVTDISGQRNGETILALTPAGVVNAGGTSLQSDNLLFVNEPYVDVDGITFSTSSGYYNLCSYGTIGSFGCGSGYQDINGTTGKSTQVRLTVTNVPEPAAMALFGMGLIGLFFVRRKLTA